jgi:diadenylate cyclase
MIGGTGISGIFRDIMSFLGVSSGLDIVRAVVDIGIVSFVIYRTILLVRDTRAIQLGKGILIILAAMYASKWLGLRTVEYILSNSIQLLGFTLVIIFQPELRRVLEQIGRSRFKDIISANDADGYAQTALVIEEITKACTEMSKNYTGALIVLEKQTHLGEIIQKGTEINARVSSELLLNIFTPKTPLHDGAVVIEDNKIKAAACILPLTDNPELGRDLGTRHRAAIGITEISDALAVVVSEQNGKISFMINGGIKRSLTPDALKQELHTNLLSTAAGKPAKGVFLKVRNRHGTGKGT